MTLSFGVEAIKLAGNSDLGDRTFLGFIFFFDFKKNKKKNKKK